MEVFVDFSSLYRHRLLPRYESLSRIQEEQIQRVLPKFTGFEALRVLVLNTVELLTDHSVKCFFQSCTLLEDLSLLDCFTRKLYTLCISCPNLKRLTVRYRQRFGHEEEFYRDNKVMCEELKISCPKLVFLMLTGEVACAFSFENLESLKEAVIHPEELSEWESPFIDGFAGISHVETLSISLYCIAMVKRLEDWKLDDVETMRILTRCLKLVEFIGFHGEECKLVVARSLLEHGNALEKMSFLWRKESEHHEKSMKAMNEISNFHKASSTVKLRSVIESAHS